VRTVLRAGDLYARVADVPGVVSAASDGPLTAPAPARRLATTRTFISFVMRRRARPDCVSVLLKGRFGKRIGGLAQGMVGDRLFGISSPAFAARHDLPRRCA
jgi:hypothetical protein